MSSLLTVNLAEKVALAYTLLTIWFLNCIRKSNTLKTIMNQLQKDLVCITDCEKIIVLKSIYILVIKSNTQIFDYEIDVNN